MSEMYRFCKLYAFIIALSMFGAGVASIIVVAPMVQSYGLSVLITNDELFMYFVASSIITLSMSVFLVRAIADCVRLSAKHRESYMRHVVDTSLEELADEKFRMSEFENRLDGCSYEQEDKLLEKYK